MDKINEQRPRFGAVGEMQCNSLRASAGRKAELHSRMAGGKERGVVESGSG